MINRFVHTTFFIAAFITGCFFVSGCENDMRQIKEMSDRSIGVEEAFNIRTVYTNDARLKAILTSPLMHRYIIDTPKIIFPKSLYVKFYDSTKKVESELSAKYGRYYENESRVLLRDSVVVFNIKGDTLKTEELYWEQSKAQFYTDKPVKIIQQGKPLLGRKGMISDQSFTHITIFDPVGLLPVADSVLPQ